MDGVITTTAGWIGSVEVVEVEFDPNRTTYADLLAHAVNRKCALRVFPRNTAQLRIARAKVGQAAERSDARTQRASDQKYYLAQSALRFVPMTRVQATRINADMQHAADYLSPRQRRIWAAAEASPAGFQVCIDREMHEVWGAAWSAHKALDRSERQREQGQRSSDRPAQR